MFGIPIFTNIWAQVLGAGLLVSLLGTGWYYYQNSVHLSDLNTQKLITQNLQQEITTKDFIITSYETVIKQKQQDLTDQRRITQEISDKWNSVRKDNASLSSKLATLTLEAKNIKVSNTPIIPGMDPFAVLEGHVNEINTYTLRCNELITGASLLDQDMTNDVCPDLIMLRSM